MQRFLTATGVAVLLAVSFAVPALARREPPVAPPPVEIDSVCLDRASGWKVAGECSREMATVTFDGVTEHPAYFLTDHVGLPGGTNYALVLLGYSGLHPWQYPTNSVPVTLTGDGSVSVCIADNGTLRAPSDPDCVTEAVI